MKVGLTAAMMFCWTLIGPAAAGETDLPVSVSRHSDPCADPAVTCDLQGEAGLFVATVERLNHTLRSMTCRRSMNERLPELKQELKEMGRLGHKLFECEGAIVPAGALKKRLDEASRTLEREGARIAGRHFFDSPELFALLALGEQPYCACFRTEEADEYAQALALRVLEGEPPRESVQLARRARSRRADELGRPFMRQRSEDYAGGNGSDRRRAVHLKRVLSGELDADDEEVDELMEDYVIQVYPGCGFFDVLTLSEPTGCRYEVQILNLGLVGEQGRSHQTLALMPVFFLVKEAKVKP